MKFVSLLVAFCFSMNVFAATGSVAALEKTVDEYHYALSVEWDQKDASFYNAQTQKFFSDLKSLIKEQGLSQAEVLAFAESKLGNKQAVEALKLKAMLLGKSASSEELAKLVQEASKDFYAQGASWNGSSTILTVAIVAVIVGVIAYSVWWDANHECVAYESQYVCNTYNNCNYYGGGYNDGYGGGYYGGSCYGTGYTTCGYADVCTQYVRKD